MHQAKCRGTSLGAGGTSAISTSRSVGSPSVPFPFTLWTPAPFLKERDLCGRQSYSSSHREVPLSSNRPGASLGSINDFRGFCFLRGLPSGPSSTTKGARPTAANLDRLRVPINCKVAWCHTRSQTSKPCPLTSGYGQGKLRGSRGSSADEGLSCVEAKKTSIDKHSSYDSHAEAVWHVYAPKATQYESAGAVGSLVSLTSSGQLPTGVAWQQDRLQLVKQRSRRQRDWMERSCTCGEKKEAAVLKSREISGERRPMYSREGFKEEGGTEPFGFPWCWPRRAVWKTQQPRMIRHNEGSDARR